MNENEKILPVFIEDEMQKSYLDYSMSMITSRALPDVRDGLKPVHRRVLFGMDELGVHHNRQPKKCARVVGDVIGKYHPHGDTAVYDSLVRMAQDFSMRYKMVNGQGNFGSIDGDPPAAMRYTECRMEAIAEEMLADLDKETVGFVSNYDDSLKEPSVLPSKVPFLLVNGTTGIAVGMATNMAPHNLNEVVDAINLVIDDPETPIDDIFKVLPGPDFPTGGVIYGRSGIYQAYRTGRGKVVIRAKAQVDKKPNDREEIIISEIPYMVNKSNLLEKMADLVRQKTIPGISFIRDESDRRGLRIVVGVKKDDYADVVLNQLYKYTNLQTTFGIINLALVDLQPKLLNIKEMISHFIEHRHDVVVKRTQYDLNKAKDKAHILEGLRIALDHIDEIVALIRASSSPDEAQRKLQEQFGLSEAQAKAILDMRLHRLTSLERDKIEQEYQQLLKLISELTEILEDKGKRMQIIKDELKELKQRFGDPRKTEISDATSDVDIEDLIAEEDMVITMTHEGYIKRTAITTYRAQARGGKGVKGMESKENDFISTLFVASTHAYILFFTNTGRCYWLKVYKMPEAGRNSRGKPIVNLINLRPEEKIAAFVPVREFDDNHFIIAATKMGVINKQPLSSYSNVRRDGVNAINLDEGDALIECSLTSGDNDIILGTKNGQAVRFNENAARVLGRNTRGVKGITLRNDDFVVGMIIVSEDHNVLTVTKKGFGKCTKVADYRRTNRGGTGIINIKVSEKNGPVVSLKGVQGEYDLMIITRKGIIIRLDVNKISIIGRNTQGVKLISLDQGDEVIDVELCEKSEDQVSETPLETASEDLDESNEQSNVDNQEHSENDENSKGDENQDTHE
ncbi:DNA gyrase subunit A [Chitinispirillales bacterium ANBcel5]|uniref:DNA gyrase subunit A n=1 Tax=Cellulosispirillum alkaliphilum TaxID=3039283 RepID=UPI002A516693|nr:DNA gyrase subunit A [Chitinispirillales bacterium ANBcel5]